MTHGNIFTHRLSRSRWYHHYHHHHLNNNNQYHHSHHNNNSNNSGNNNNIYEFEYWLDPSPLTATFSRVRNVKYMEKRSQTMMEVVVVNRDGVGVSGGGNYSDCNSNTSSSSDGININIHTFYYFTWKCCWWFFCSVRKMNNNRLKHSP